MGPNLPRLLGLYSTCSKDTFGEQRLLSRAANFRSHGYSAEVWPHMPGAGVLPVPEPPMSSQVKTDEETQGSPKDCFLPSTSYMMSWLLKCFEGFGPLPRAGSITY